MVRLWTADVPDVLTTSQPQLAYALSRCPPVAARAVASIIARESSKHPQTRLPADHSAQTSQCNISLAGNLQPHPQSATADTLSYASTRYSSICSFATVRSDPCLLRSSAKPMGEPLPPPQQQQCAAPLPNRPEEEALHLDHPTPASADRQPPMQTSADAAAASTHADRQTDAPPVFWSTRHSRSTSYHSISHLGPGTIQLEDHSEEQHEQSQGCWARSVTVDDYTVVSGSSGLGAYVVWSLTVSTLKGGDMSIRKRYSEFDRLRENLVKAFPHAEGSIPQLPRKSVVSRFRPRFLEQRKNGLSHFISCILLNPEFSSSPILKDFIFS